MNDIIKMLLWCPECTARHIDTGEYATKPHHTHACQFCGHVWRPAIENTCGVIYLSGFKNTDQTDFHNIEYLVSLRLQTYDKFRQHLQICNKCLHDIKNCAMGVQLLYQIYVDK